ncbi:hypothetical protein M408DRAFT_25416 [Serendipita vermifera MAFF 305830]|uniref:F-box domain-containing protein n=1 Tax=Serendipita vermifera MAFF 305830 TaxID=933852 RepID=A0A0C2XBA7_SERVB|nr:hypothetical protein M408DRAFT_25416 [Serendipita vermifera MAFF 305830]
MRKLNDNIATLKAWIAPIKQLPFDVLTLVFIEATNQDRLAPLTIELVCTTWRSYILKTHRAWSYVSVGERFNPAITLKYLVRSEPFPVHLDIVRSSVEIVDQVSHHISEYASRIRTLEIDANSYRSRGWRMSSLKCLRFFGRVTPEIFFGKLNWGELKVEYLKITPLEFGASSRPLIRQHLTHLLHLVIEDQRHYKYSWVMFVEECSMTLKTLEIRLTGSTFYNRRPPQLPSLERLEVEVNGIRDYKRWPFNATTPLLRWYKEMRHPDPNLLDPVVFHTGTEHVLHLQMDVVPQLERYPRLRCLHLSPITRIIDSAKLKAIHAEARRLCKEFEALFLDDKEGRIVKSGGNFLYCVDEGGNESFEVSQGCTSSMPFEPEPF